MPTLALNNGCWLEVLTLSDLRLQLSGQWPLFDSLPVLFKAQVCQPIAHEKVEKVAEKTMLASISKINSQVVSHSNRLIRAMFRAK